MSRLSTRQIAALKRTAQNNYPLMIQREKIGAQIKALMNQYQTINTQIEGAEAGSRAISGGFSSLELIERVVITKPNAQGVEVKMTKFQPRENALRLNEDGTYEVLLVREEPVVPADAEEPENEERTQEAE